MAEPIADGHCSCVQFSMTDPVQKPPSDPNERKHYINHGPIQPRIDTFPKTNGRAFNKQWYDKYSWLEYSVDKDAVFCFVCRLFASTLNSSQSSTVFTISGFKDWSKALASNRGFQQHSMSKDHHAAAAAYEGYKKTKSVLCQLSDDADKRETQKAIQIVKNRTVVGRIFGVVRLLAKLGLPFRGHREDEQSTNTGLFLELIQFIATSGDVILNDHLQIMPANATYLSADIQNQMIDVIGDGIQEVVVSDIKGAGYYSILMDETTDASHREQVSIMARFVDTQTDNKDNVVRERLIAVVQANATTGEALTQLLLDTLNKVGLNIDLIVGQGYDGGSNMRGSSKGVQARIKELNPRAMYTHCFAHSLNRALVNAVSSKEHASARNFFGIVELTYTFTEGSAMRHQHFISCQEGYIAADGGKNAPLHLKGLSETRWNCRAESLNRLAKPQVYRAVIDTIEHIADTTSDGTVRGVSSGLKTSLMDYSFIAQLFTMQPVLSIINETSILLQSTQLDLLQAYTYVNALSMELATLRSDSAWCQALDKAKDLAHLLGVEAEFACTRKRKVPRRHLDNPTVSAQQSDVGDDAEARSDYFAVIDRLCAELQERFPKSLQHFAPLQCVNMDIIDAEIQLAELVEIYSLDISLIAQWRLLRQHCGRQRSTSIAACYFLVPREHTALRQAYQILLTLPVTSAGVERSFSKLALIKSKLRTTMTQHRLQALMFASIEKDILGSLSCDDLVSKFARKGDRRMDLG